MCALAAQLYDTCPIPNLPRTPYKPGGGPVGKDPPLLLPPTLTTTAVTQATSQGLLVQEQNSTTYTAAAKGTVTAGPQVTSVGQLLGPVAGAAKTEQTIISLNIGDSWAIRWEHCFKSVY